MLRKCLSRHHSGRRASRTLLSSGMYRINLCLNTHGYLQTHSISVSYISEVSACGGQTSTKPDKDSLAKASSSSRFTKIRCSDIGRHAFPIAIVFANKSTYVSPRLENLGTKSNLHPTLFCSGEIIKGISRSAAPDR